MAFPADHGADYAAIVDGLESVTVLQIDADDGTTLATSAGATCLIRAPMVAPAMVGDGEVGAQMCRFVLVASGVSFVPRARDQITDPDGVKWSIESVSVEGIESLYACETTRIRT